MSNVGDITLVLQAIGRGEGKASEELLPLVYEELRRLAAGCVLGGYEDELQRGRHRSRGGGRRGCREAWLRSFASGDAGVVLRCRTRRLVQIGAGLSSAVEGVPIAGRVG